MVAVISSTFFVVKFLMWDKGRRAGTKNPFASFPSKVSETTERHSTKFISTVQFSSESGQTLCRQYHQSGKHTQKKETRTFVKRSESVTLTFLLVEARASNFKILFVGIKDGNNNKFSVVCRPS